MLEYPRKSARPEEKSTSGRKAATLLGRRIARLALRYSSILALLAGGATAVPSLAAGPQTLDLACHPLMLVQECQTYKAEMAGAAAPDARDALKVRYETLMQEREHACYCNPSRSWISLQQSVADDQTHFRRILERGIGSASTRL